MSPFVEKVFSSTMGEYVRITEIKAMCGDAYLQEVCDTMLLEISLQLCSRGVNCARLCGNSGHTSGYIFQKKVPYSILYSVYWVLQNVVRGIM
jgi:hypothetical protein